MRFGHSEMENPATVKTFFTKRTIDYENQMRKTLGWRVVTSLSVESFIAEYGWESVLVALQEEAARQLVLTGDPTARRVYNVLQVCIDEVIFRDR